jgi:hypothetical protein
MVSDTIISDSRQKHFNRFRLTTLVTALDDRLRRRRGVIEYTQSPNCLFRIERVRSQYELTLSDEAHVRLDDPIIHLHVWNEQFPPFPPCGPTLAWAQQVNRAFRQSLHELSGFLKTRQDFRDVVAICADLNFEPYSRATQLTRFVARFGFEAIATPQNWSLGRRAHWLGQNILISIVVLTYNAAALHADTLWRDRIPVFLSRRALDERYGSSRQRQQFDSSAGIRSNIMRTATR